MAETRDVRIRLSTVAGPEMGAAFKTMADRAKASDTIVSNLFLDMKRGAKDAEGRVNDLANSIKRLGLNTRDVAKMATEMGRAFDLSAKQIDAALSKAGRARIGDGGGGGGGLSASLRGGRLATTANVGLISALGADIAGLAQDISNIRLSFRRTGPHEPGLFTASERDVDLTKGTIGRAGSVLMEAGFDLLDPDRKERLQREEREVERQRSIAAMRAQRETAAQVRISTARPFEDRIRDMSMSAAMIPIEAMGVSGAGRAIGLGRAGRMSDILTRGTPTARRASDLERLTGGRESVREMALSQGQAEANAAKAVLGAQTNRNELKKEELSLARQIADWERRRAEDARSFGKQITATDAEREELLSKQTRNVQQSEQSERTLIGLLQQRNQVRQQGEQAWRNWAKDEEKHYRAVAAAEKDRLDDIKAELGLLKAGEKTRLLNISRKIARGEELAPGQVDFARSQPVFAEALRDMGLKRAATDPIIQEILRNVQADRKLREAEQAAKFFAEINAKFESEIKVQLTQDETAIGTQLQKLLPKIMSEMERFYREMEQHVDRALVQLAQNRRGMTNP